MNCSVDCIPIPQVSQSTISFGTSESSRLHLMQMMSVVVSSTAEHGLFINDHGKELGCMNLLFRVIGKRKHELLYRRLCNESYIP